MFQAEWFAGHRVRNFFKGVEAVFSHRGQVASNAGEMFCPLWGELIGIETGGWRRLDSEAVRKTLERAAKAPKARHSIAWCEAPGKKREEIFKP